MAAERICQWCDEPILPTDPNHPSIDMHRECLTRTVLGSLGCLIAGDHEEGTCDGDPPGLTKREAAKLVLDYILEKNDRVH